MTCRKDVLGVALVVTMLCADGVLAQTRGRVIRDGATIWRAETAIAATTVPVGTVLTITGRTDAFFLVVIPASAGGQGELGRIAVALVELLPGSAEPGVPTTPVAGPESVSRDSVKPQAAPARAVRRTEPAVAVRGVGLVGLTRLAAAQSFEAVLGQSHGLSFGAGAQVRFRNGLFVEAAVTQFRKTGERVFVFNETVFPLGIANTITIRPLTVVGGYRFRPTRTIVPYAGAGFASYQLRERSTFTEETETVDERHGGLRVLGGVEIRHSGWLTTSAEAAYTRVPDAIGLGGVSEAFDEHDLGGLQMHLKVLIGR